MILVTGAYGFIGSQFVKFLNSKGVTNIIVSDYMDNGRQFKNLNGCTFAGYIHPDSKNINRLIQLNTITHVYHLGAVSDTTCWDGNFIMKRNYEYSADLISHCVASDVKVTYASSASVYGNGNGPLNVYAYSKFLVDSFVAGLKNKNVQGFRYFNVYSNDDSEWHKGDMASPYYKFKQSALETGQISVFEGSETFKRDFVHVQRVCGIQYELSQPETFRPGIFDLGSGIQKSFMDVAKEVADQYDAKIVEVPFPEHLKGTYQTSTLADMSYM